MTDALAPVRRFSALRNRHSRPYLFSAGLSMMGDNNEHVITYWVLWERFHSPALVGFEVISHWLPFLLLSVRFGSLAQKYDCRRLIQIAQALFMFVSAMWGVLFFTNSLQVWEACILLVLHGTAGALWGPAEQMLLHDFADRSELPNAIRLNATFRSLGVLFGPVVGGALLLVLGPTLGIFVNVGFYLFMMVLMFRTPFTGHTRDGLRPPPRASMLDTLKVFGRIRSNHLLVGMLVISGLVAFFIGNSLQVAMPVFAQQLGAGRAGLAYGILLFAIGAGAVLGGFGLEALHVIRPSLPAAIVAAALYGAAILVFATTSNYVVAVVALAFGGLGNMATMSITQAIVQLEAPVDDRGRVVGLYGMFGQGFQTFNGLTVGIVGGAIGIGHSVAITAALLVIGAVVAGLFAASGRRKRSRQAHAGAVL